MRRTSADKRRQLPQKTFGRRIRNKTKEAKRQQQRVNSGDLEMLQSLQSEIENCVRPFRIRRRGMAEAAPGFKSRPNVGKVDEIVTCGNTREQRNGDQSYRNDAANSGPGRADALALRKAENCQTTDGKQQPGEVENSDQLRNIITALRYLTDATRILPGS